ncbi:MAG: hypothetical protein ACKO8Q_04420, partial [Bacteroidota bacterium]
KLVCRSGAAVDVLFETGSSLHLLGNPSLDTMLLVKEGCMFNDDGEGGWVEWNSAHVEMENQSHVVSFRKNVFMHSWLMGVHSNFTVQWDDFSFFQSRIKGVNVRNDHGDFVFRQSIAELNKIQVYFGNYRIEGSTLIQSELKSFNLKSRSRILESCFYDSEMAVSDESLIELYVYRSTFSNSNTALNKKGGRLRLRCNLFQSNETGLSLEKGCLLYLSADEAAGYNSFIDQNEAILLSFARTPILFDGENSFENCANIMEGSVVDATCMTQLKFGKQYFDVPPYNLINVESAVSSSLGAPCVLGIILGENTVDFCPQEGGGISLANSNSKMLKQVIVQPGGIEVEFDSLFSCVSNKFFGLDSTRSIKEGLALLSNGLMQLNTEEANEDDYKVLHSAFYLMSWMLDDMVHRREIILSNNSIEFETSVESVFKVYNKFSFLASEAGYIHTQFYLELEKIRILEMLGLSEQALYLFENLNQCNVEIGELDFLRFWEKILKNEINGENGQPIGESELLSFGVSDEPFAFGSNVLSPQDVYVYPCIAKSKQMSIEAENFCGGNYNLLGQGIQHYKPSGGLNIDVIFLNGKKQVLVVH